LSQYFVLYYFFVKLTKILQQMSKKIRNFIFDEDFSVVPASPYNE